MLNQTIALNDDNTIIYQVKTIPLKVPSCSLKIYLIIIYLVLQQTNSKMKSKQQKIQQITHMHTVSFTNNNNGANPNDPKQQAAEDLYIIINTIIKRKFMRVFQQIKAYNFRNSRKGLVNENMGRGFRATDDPEYKVTKRRSRTVDPYAEYSRAKLLRDIVGKLKAKNQMIRDLNQSQNESIEIRVQNLERIIQQTYHHGSMDRSNLSDFSNNTLSDKKVNELMGEIIRLKKQLENKKINDGKQIQVLSNVSHHSNAQQSNHSLYEDIIPQLQGYKNPYLQQKNNQVQQDFNIEYIKSNDYLANLANTNIKKQPHKTHINQINQQYHTKPPYNHPPRQPMPSPNYQAKIKNEQKVIIKNIQPNYGQNYGKSPSNRVTFSHTNSISQNPFPNPNGQFRSTNNRGEVYPHQISKRQNYLPEPDAYEPKILKRRPVSSQKDIINLRKDYCIDDKYAGTRHNQYFKTTREVERQKPLQKSNTKKYEQKKNPEKSEKQGQSPSISFSKINVMSPRPYHQASQSRRQQQYNHKN